MKIIYGKGECSIDYSQDYKHISIKYRGNISLLHSHREVIKIEGTRVYIVNKNSTSFLINQNNTIDILFKKSVGGLIELFKYNGTFKILSTKIDKKNIGIETQNIDYCELINSKFDNMGKPEQYKGAYFVGNVPKRRRKRTTKRLSTKTTTRRSGGGGY